MSHITSEQYQSIKPLLYAARQHFTRGVFILEGNSDWVQAFISQFMQDSDNLPVCQLGGNTLFGTRYYSAKQGRQLLGVESRSIVVSLDDGFDANSFNAAVGSLVGGGCLILVCRSISGLDPWLQSHLFPLPILSEGQGSLRDDNHWLSKMQALSLNEGDACYDQQSQAITLIEKVLSGHRKRPLVLTANRGRGKSSALGLAAKRLLAQAPLTIIVVAPSKQAVAPIFEHADVSNRHLDASLIFVAPDELLEQRPKCDLLFVDEAAATPVSMLKSIIENYHRVVMTTTIHGYEGCGRGFSLKFVPWLLEARSGTRVYQMDQPVRWAMDDPLEAWCATTFMLGSELAEVDPVLLDKPSGSLGLSMTTFTSKEQIRQSPLLSESFALLVNAHYQTSPNDLMLLLQDDNVELHVMTVGQRVVASMLVHYEGALSIETVDSIMLGRSRPKGHLIPCDLSNHLGLSEPGTQRCARIMRIAVHPMLHSKGIGSELLSRYAANTTRPVDYLATSFGLTLPLLSFWLDSDYLPVRLGASKDQSSGTYSLALVKPMNSISDTWIKQARVIFNNAIPSQLMVANRELEPKLAWSLFSESSHSFPEESVPTLLELYANGGNALETCRWAFPSFFRILASRQIHVDSALLIGVGLLHWTWQECSRHLNFSGRKQSEAELRKDINHYIQLLQCKS
ncbi:GNAT family N-acetyltransferase [Vibrio methylphosphonaticus]|uniref:GNAT family N-acetyltransferase n=1 Tax=Vibrio methylphosphonaticus TaxID=2946866 RepID=UPI00202A214C|nr:GNAT family N-acetyltransferase [Vibrio methylphosphonaticus]MCL9775238.1 GNAT family N-acetyltransferase [Vibrio methylphosphonaticus]